MIVKMKHLDILCIASERENALEKLRSLGAVHLDLSSAKGEAVAFAKGEVANVEFAVRAILKARGKKVVSDLHASTMDDVIVLQVKINNAMVDVEGISREIAKYEPYGDFDPELAKKIIDSGIDLSSIAELPSVLPKKRLSVMKEEYQSLQKQIASLNEELSKCDEKFILSKYPILADKISFEAAKELMEEKGAVAHIEGWIPLPKVDAFVPFAKAESWGYLIRDPQDNETPPTLIEPPAWCKPMKALFDGLGISPAYREADVSVPFMCYFSIFFAMLVGDGAYGTIFLLSTLALRKKLEKSWFILLTVFSSATVIWGILSNTWFGASLPWCADWATVKWLADPSYNNMMFLCFTIGASHLMLARIWNGICKINDSTSLAEFGWAGILLFMYCITNSIVGIFTSIPSFMFWVFGISLVLVFGFSVKPSELKTRGAELGMLPLNIMSALGDIISYVRLFAVGLASVKVAENFNTMATGLLSGDDSLWLKALLTLAMVAILLVGHALNLAMAGLSILVHAVRLNTLEFSNHKGVSWSGLAFCPFKRISKQNINQKGEK